MCAVDEMGYSQGTSSALPRVCTLCHLRLFTGCQGHTLLLSVHWGGGEQLAPELSSSDEATLLSLSPPHAEGIQCFTPVEKKVMTASKETGPMGSPVI